MRRASQGDFFYWEDLQPSIFDLGSYTMTEEEILEFAGRFDPQPFHIDAEAAEQSPFGGLIASGWHTGSVYMGLYARNLLNYTASQGSSGVENVRWLAPVRPGDVLHATAEIVRSEPSSTKPNRGSVFVLSKLTNQDGVVVFTMDGRGLFGRRHPAAN